MSGYNRQSAVSQRLLEASPFWQQLHASADIPDAETTQMVLDAAANFAEGIVAPLATLSDREGCRIENGRVKTPEAYKPAWNALCEDGWLGLDLPEHAGGQGLPVTLHTAAQLMFDRACLAFVMLGGSTRSGVFAIDAFGDEKTKQQWLPKLISGEWSVTICISEADAGSDVGRIRTRAEQQADGSWTITGQKCWISYGDHDLTSNIGQLLLARTQGPETGTRGLSLFLVPSIVKNSAGESIGNSIKVERIEEKLGLHGSPTCVMAFDNASAILLGEINRGLPQLFVMIERMRLLTAGMGVGTALAALDIAEQYAVERHQGGAPDKPAIAIIEHADIQRQLGVMASRSWAALAFVLELSAIMDSASMGDAMKRDDYKALVAWLLPIAKNFAAEIGFDTANGAIQVLGGAGFTQEWAAERLLRDSRILSIFEGTTAMQASDLLHRRLWKEEGRGLALFIEAVEADLEACKDEDAAQIAREVLARLLEITTQFEDMKQDKAAAEFSSNGFFRATWAGVFAWMSLRLVSFGLAPRDDLDRYLSSVGRFGLHEALADIKAAKASIAVPASSAVDIAHYIKQR